MIQPFLVILPSLNKGRGVFTTEKIRKGTVVEISPVIILNEGDRPHIDKTVLHDYIFEWDGEVKTCCMALGFIPIYNHKSPSNCEYEMDYENDTINITAVQDIAKGEELFINYNGLWSDSSPVWFDAE